MKPILEIQNISKKFRIFHESLPYETLSHKLMHPSHFFTSRVKEEFWALNDISFNVAEGESVAIIGKNGAGKSTLLKILSKITPPSTGKIISRGRIASLLEVGTGFHAELTGRENIFLNGSILGMRRKEIDKHFDEIIDFSGVEKFLDTPLKHYSSGMQLRLAFSVAAFLEPEILIIDEVLAVGDSEFQKKCMGKMNDVSKSGRTVLFVSHNMSAIRQLCRRSVLLEKGKVVMDDTSENVIDSYLKQNLQKENAVYFTNEHDNEHVALKSVVIHGENKNASEPIFMNENVHIDVEFVNKSAQNLDVTIDLFDEQGNYIFHVGTMCSKEGTLAEGTYKTTGILPANLLNSITYSLNLIIGKNQRQALIKIDYIAVFKVEKFLQEQTSARTDNFPGILHPQLEWQTKRI